MQSEGGSTLVGSGEGIAATSISGGPLVRCRSFFSARLAGLGESGSDGGIDLRNIHVAVTKGLHVLHFPLGAFFCAETSLHTSNTKYSRVGIGKVYTL
jgi:hypothetical protein